MISVITPTYKTPREILARTWASLKNQTYVDWEWVVFDDSPGWDTWNHLYGLCADERYRIRVYRPHTPSGGNIGAVKRDAFMLGRGDILVELDHDDELTADALGLIANAFSDINVGFAWSDCTEILPSGDSGRYPDGWGLGYGQHYWDVDHQVWASRVPMNRVTLSHIVSAPNHVRAWRASVYHAIGGHNQNFHVADDYDLILRTAAATHCHHIPKMIYKQHIAPTTAQRTMNADIQHLVPYIHALHSDALDAVWGPLQENAEQAVVG